MLLFIKNNIVKRKKIIWFCGEDKKVLKNRQFDN